VRKLLFAAVLGAGAAHAEDRLDAHLRAQFEQVRANPANPFGVRDWSRTVRTAEVRWQWDAPFAAAVRGGALMRSASGEPGRGTVNELSFERALGEAFISIGKKVMSWDVGYGFRPLDVVQQEDRRALYPSTPEGVPMLAWESFGEASAVTVVVSNPGRGRAGQPRGDGSLAVRLYRHGGGTDQYAVLRLSRRNGAEGGIALSDVRNEALELHASVLFQQRHDTWSGARWLGRGGGGKALAGMTWTTAAKLSLLGEAWLDRTALPGQQRNLLVRGAQDFGDLELAADMLWQRRDGSRIAGLSLSWTPAPWAWNLSVRRYGGAAGRAVKRAAIATLQRAF
jgi:hypothetical protein